MLFGADLVRKMVPEWRTQYIRYEEMKVILYETLNRTPPDSHPDKKAMYIQTFEEEFLGFCMHQIDTINSFFKEKLAEATRIFVKLKREMSYCRFDLSEVKSGRFSFLSRGTRKKKMDFELAFSELYLRFVQLQGYQNVNHEGFCKILKKHDKMFNTTRGASFRDQHVNTAAFFTAVEVDRYISEIEDLVTGLERGDRARAMKKLRVPTLRDTDGSWATFTLGLFTGISIILFIEVVSSGSVRVDGIEFDWKTLIRLYRGPCLLSMYIMLLGMNIHCWSLFGVNHILIFDFDPRSHLFSHDLLEISAVLNCAWLGSALVFLEHKHFGVPLYSSPLALLVFYVLFLFNPTNTLWLRGRFWFLHQLWRLVAAPFHVVSFAEFWLADQMSSLTAVFLDLEYMICIFTFRDTLKVEKAVVGECLKFCSCNDPTSIVRPFLRWLPSAIRIIQCFRRWYDGKIRQPHLLNAGKYFCASLCILLSSLLAYYDHVWSTNGPKRVGNPFFYMWILASVISSLYSYYWDVKRDWGLFDTNSGENKYLREEIIYRYKAFYYFAIVEDLILRFTWTVSLTLTEVNYASADYVITLFAPLELFRRFIWNFFRLENEHLNNCGQFRAVRDIAKLPSRYRESTIQVSSVLEVMDDNDGMETANLRRKSSLTVTCILDTLVTKDQPSEPS